MGGIRRYLPGLVVLVTVGLLARSLAAITNIGSTLVVAIGLGTLIGNMVDIPEVARPGIKTDTLWLEAGIVLMGVSIALGQVIEAGPRVLLVVVAAVCMMLLTVETLSRWPFTVPSKVGSLLAAGTSICGVSAVAAVSGSIDPDSRQVAYAAATVLVFDAITLVVYPLVGQMLGLSDIVYGVWAGTTMFSTGPVTAAGFVYSETAGQWAVLVKLTRNALIGLVAIGYAIYYSRQTMSTSKPDVRYLWDSFPKFILGFIGLMVLANLAVFSPAQIQTLDNTSNWLFLVAFTGLGLQIDLDMLRSTGVTPALVVAISLCLVSGLTLVTLLWLF